MTETYEDFILPTHSRITALNLFGSTLTYSQYPDFYEFRVLQKNGDKWQIESLGPFIDKTIDQVYACTGLHYLDLTSNKNANLIEF